jgi:predicted SprT family Zn-dependent metalloprotease
MESEIRALIDRWGAEWGLPDLASSVYVTFSSRLKRSIGRCRPATGRITLHKDLLVADPERLAEVLCHEVGHVAAFQLFGSGTAPHGPEWRELVERVGFQPSTRTRESVPAPLISSSPSTILPYEHRCPVCQSVRFARRPVGRWRCGECMEAGLDGELVISRNPRAEPRT